MQTKTFFTTLLAALPAAQAFQFTGPDPSKDLDVRKEIVITWSGDIPDNLSPKFDFTWYTEPDELHVIGSQITQLVYDVYLDDHEFRLNVSNNFHNMLDEFAKELAEKPLFSFQAVFTDKNGEEVEYWSKNYTLIGLGKKPWYKSWFEL